MSDIPCDLYNNILVRLPAKSLLLFRQVCKSWRQIIDDPSFIKSHIENYQSDDQGQLLVKHRTNGNLFLLSMDFIKSDQQEQDIIEAIQVKNLVPCGLPPLYTLPIASCNGLILIPHGAPMSISVLPNPLTREYHHLPPQCEYNDHKFLLGFGLGYDSINNDYKVVQISTDHNGTVFQTFVYSLRFDSWKRIEDCPQRPCRHNNYSNTSGTYLNGVLYWVSTNSVIALDLGTEHYRRFSMPPLRPEKPGLMTNLVMNLDVLGGCLILSCNYIPTDYRMELFGGFEGWVMKDDGGQISWTKLFSLSKNVDPQTRSWYNLRPITYSKSVGRVLLHNDRVFYWLNTHNNSAKKVRIHGLPDNYGGIFSCQVWQGSLFRFRNFVAAKGIEPVSKKLRAN